MRSNIYPVGCWHYPFAIIMQAKGWGDLRPDGREEAVFESDNQSSICRVIETILWRNWREIETKHRSCFVASQIMISERKSSQCLIWLRKNVLERAWLPDGYSRLKDYGSATLHCKIGSLSFFGLRPTPFTLAQSKERKGSNFAIWQHCERAGNKGKRWKDRREWNESQQTKSRGRIDDTEALSFLRRHLTAISSPLRSRLAKNFTVQSMSEQDTQFFLMEDYWARKYRDRLKCLYVVARSLLLILLTGSA